MLNSMGQAILIKMTLWPDAGAGCKKERTTSKSCNDPIVITFQHRSQMTIWAKLPSSSRAVETQPDLDDLFCYTPITICLASTEPNCNEFLKYQACLTPIGSHNLLPAVGALDNLFTPQRRNRRVGCSPGSQYLHEVSISILQ